MTDDDDPYLVAAEAYFLAHVPRGDHDGWAESMSIASCASEIKFRWVVDAARQPLLNRIAQLEAEVDDQRGRRIVERSKNIELEERLLLRDAVAARAIRVAEARIAELEAQTDNAHTDRGRSDG
jgi:hypothetical protein